MMSWLKKISNWWTPPNPPVEDSTPKAEIIFVDGKLLVKSYNSAFVADLRSKHGDLFLNKTDDEVVQLFAQRESIQFEEPKLEVVHSGITEDGRVQMKLDWNQAFIRHLQQNGITAETEEEAVETYLMMIQKKVADQEHMINLDPTEAFREMDEIRAVELEEAARQVEEAQRKARKSRRKPKKQDDK